MDKSHVSIGILKEAMYCFLSQNCEKIEFGNSFVCPGSQSNVV
ncbi:hypothetical protein T09_14066 [Trichinella sp. T9]|nr:hypothetical protein T09_14066 [Trichinella sp. T9]